MEEIIKKGKADGIQLPMLPYYQEYGYDPDKKELVVIEYPAKKKAMEEQTARDHGKFLIGQVVGCRRDSCWACLTRFMSLR